CLVVDDHHHDVGPGVSILDAQYLDAVLLRHLPGFAALVEADDYVAAAVLEVQGVGMPLASIAENRELLAVEQRNVGVALVIDSSHSPLPLTPSPQGRGKNLSGGHPQSPAR